MAQSVMLGWEQSPDPNAVGYNIYYGTSSHNYSNKVSVGNVTSTTLSGLVPGGTYFFAATTYDAANQESGFSNEASYAIPLHDGNQPPTLGYVGDLIINENSIDQSVALSGITSGAANEEQPLEVTAVSSNPTLIPNPTVVYTSPNSTGALTFKPVTSASGYAIITVSVNDGGTSNNITTRSFTITVNPNLPPTVVVPTNVVVNENVPAQTIYLSGITSGSPNEDQPLKVTVASSKTTLIPTPTVVYASPNSTGALTFKPVNNATGSATITVTVNDGGTRSNLTTKTFNITVNQTANLPPTLNTPADVVVNENVPVQSIPLSGITSGSPNEDQPLTISVVSSKTTLIPTPVVVYTSPNSRGSLTFKPVNNATGSATITVTVNDGGTVSNLTTRAFNLTVNPVPNIPPSLNALENVVLNENATNKTVIVSGITSGSVNEDQPLKVTAVSSNPALIPNPTVAYTSPNSTGALTFKPATNASGSVVITVSVNDGGTSNNITTRSFTTTVNPNLPPTVIVPTNLVVNENVPVQTIPLSGITSGSPTEVQTLKVTVASSKTTLIPIPTVVYTSPNSTGALTFKPVNNASGTATISVTVNDGSSRSNLTTKTFNITVNHVPNIPPTLNALEDVVVNENATNQTVSLSGIATGSVNEDQPLKVTAVSSKPTLIPNPTVVYTSPNSTGVLTFKPVTSASGSAIITVSVNDGGTSNNITTRSFTITVNPNLPPTVVVPTNVVVNENVPVQTIYLSGITSGSPNENQPLKVTVASSKTTLIPTPTVVYTSPNSTGALSFKPVNNASGTATISVTVNDGSSRSNLTTKTFNITVNHVPNIPPTLNALEDVVVNENATNQTVSLSGITTGSVNEDQPLKVTAVSSKPTLIPNPTVVYTSPNSTGVLTFKPVTSASGSAIITVSVNDGGTSNNITTRSFTITVNPNLPPTVVVPTNVVVNENVPVQTIYLSGITSGSPNENQPLKVTVASSKTTLIPTPTVVYTSPNSTGALSFKPVNNATGSATITVTVNDGGTRSNLTTKTFNITVNQTTNLPPTLNALADVVVNENVPVQSIPLSGITSGSPNEDQPLTISVVSSKTTLIPTPAVVYTSPNSKGSLTFKPLTNANGSAFITVTVNDGGTSNNIITRSFTVTVNHVNVPPTLDAITNITVNQPPTLDAISDFVVNQNAGLQTISLTGISSGDALGSQNLTVTAASNDTTLIPNPTVSFASSNSTGSISFKPVANKTGTTVMRVTVKDNGNPNRTVTQTFIATVLGQTNNAGSPIINGLVITNTAVAGQDLAFSVAAAGQAQLRYQWKFNGGDITFATNATLSLNRVDSSQSGDYSVLVFNQKGATNSAVVNLNVSPGSGATPVVNPPQNVWSQTIALTGISSGSTRETQTLNITAISSNPSLIPDPVITYVSPQTNGSLNFTPLRTASGTAIISVTVNDGGASNNIITKQFIITVNPGTPAKPAAGSQFAGNDNSQTPVANFIINQKTNQTGGAESAPNLSAKSDSATTSRTLDPGISSASPALIANTNDSQAGITVPPPSTTLTAGGLVDGRFSLIVTGQANYECVLQASTNLVDWFSINTNTIPFEFTDYNAGQFKQRFYRAVGK